MAIANLSRSVRRIVIGTPLATEEAPHQRMDNVQALAVFASDALSSVAYATQEILTTLAVAAGTMGAAVFGYSIPVSLCIVALLAILNTSYHQTIHASPEGGGAYRIGRKYISEGVGQLAAAALAVDYVLTVAVSVTAGVDAVTSAFHPLIPFHVWVGVACVLLIMMVNLRGVRESARIFMYPTYLFILGIYATAGVGFYQWAMHMPVLPMAVERISFGRHFVTTFLLLKAFSSGCTALTGVEAISNGVAAFKVPTSINANKTMTAMSLILGSMFISISVLALHLHCVPSDVDTVLSQIAYKVWGGRHFPYYFVQAATALILILAANTSFQDFPRVMQLQARDGFLPKQLTNIGDRLVFNNGIKLLAALACILIVAFGGNTTRLIPLYAVGVFLSFSISDAGMVSRWHRLREKGWQRNIVLNAMGAITTFIVMWIQLLTKFLSGAWIITIIIPCLVTLYFRIHRYYVGVAKQLSMEGYRPKQGWRHHVLVLIPEIHRGIIPALQYARAISPDPRAVHVATDPMRVERLTKHWDQWSRGIPLLVLASPYRSLLDPIIDQIDLLQLQDPGCLVTIIVPEFVPARWWAQFLHGQTGLALKFRLFFKRGVVVTNVPYHLDPHVEIQPHDTERHGSIDHDPLGHPITGSTGAPEAVAHHASRHKVENR